MAKDNRDFELFQREFKRYQAAFGLLGYQVYFAHEPLSPDVWANIKVDQEGMVANVCLNSKMAKDTKSWNNVRRHAKHEATHLLVARLQKYGESRYITEPDMIEATEELVFRLEELIPDLPEET